MSVVTVIMETFGMMLFTFIVGMGVAYLIKLLTFSFYFFDKEHLALVVKEYKLGKAVEKRHQSELRKRLYAMEKMSDIDRIRYIYENKNTRDPEEEVDDVYDLFKFYKGIYKDKKENEGIDSLIRYYYNNGEV